MVSSALDKALVWYLVAVPDHVRLDPESLPRIQSHSLPQSQTAGCVSEGSQPFLPRSSTSLIPGPMIFDSASQGLGCQGCFGTC